MGRFIDEVNAVIPNIKEVKEKEILEYKKDALMVASEIKKRILEIAKQHLLQETFKYEGMLFTQSYFIEKKVKEEEYGLFSYKIKREMSFFLNERAHFFYSELHKELEKDNIHISEWQVARIHYPNPDNDAFISYCEIPFSNSGAFSYLYLYDKWRPKHTRLNISKGPYIFNSAFNIVTKGNYVKASYKDEFIDNFIDSPYACISIRFWNKLD